MSAFVWSLVIGVIGGLIAFFSFRFLYVVFLDVLRRRSQLKTKSILLEVRVGRENERGPLVMEQFFASLHGIYKQFGWWDRFWGSDQDSVSFEVANIDNKIRFYIWTPKKYKNLVEGQMYAQYPDIEMSEVEDYSRIVSERRTLKGHVHGPMQKGDMPIVDSTRLLPGSNIEYAVAAELELKEIDLFPIKRFGQFEDRIMRVHVDPLAGITAALSQLNAKDEQLWIQMVVRPTGESRRHQNLRALRVLKKIVARWPFREYFYLKTQVERLYTVRSWFYWFLFSPLYIFLWMYRGGGIGNVLSTQQTQSSQSRDDEELREEMTRQHDRETDESAAVSKIAQLGFDTNIRFVYVPSPTNLHLADVKLQEIAGSFKQFNIPHLNEFQVRVLNKHNAQLISRFHRRDVVDPFMLSIEELATVYHFPNLLVQTPNIHWVSSKRLEPPVDLPTPITVPESEFTMLGKTNFRGDSREFGIKAEDRRRHIYIIGKTGMGKSTLLNNMVYSDVFNNKGVGVIDPHGDLAESIIDFVPSHRTNDVILFDPSDTEFPISFNMMECKQPEHRPLVASGLIGVFKKMYAESWGPRLEHILRNTILALLEYPNSTILGIMKMLVDSGYRKKVLKQVTNPLVRSFWLDEFAKMQDRQRTEAISPIQNKVGQFLSSPVIRNILGQTKSKFDLRYAMDNKKIVVVNLSKGKIGEDSSALLGSLLITKFQLDAMSRADIPEKERVDFYLYVDEFQNFATDSFATILSEARKYKLNLTMANQYVAQMPEEVRDSVFGNVGTMISFQVGFDDAEMFSKQYAEEVLPNDIVQLPKYTAYTKLLVDGMPSKVFSLATLPPPDFEHDEERRKKVIKVCREKYATTREVIEDKILRWSGMKDDEDDSSSKGKGEGKEKSKDDASSKGKNVETHRDAPKGKGQNKIKNNRKGKKKQ